jgi:hypothetical protein
MQNESCQDINGRKKEVTAALQDDNREWVTVLVAVCGDGTTLPPGLIYASKNSTLQSSWVVDIKLESTMSSSLQPHQDGQITTLVWPGKSRCLTAVQRRKRSKAEPGVSSFLTAMAAT